MKKLFLLSFTMLVSVSAWSQSSALAYPHVTVMTPEASSLARYSDIPVSYYTGVPDISIPLYTIKVDDFELPISLNYHSAGIRVDQEATCVGLGWSLSAGGRISRTAKGIDDFREYGYDESYPYYKTGYYDAPDATSYMDFYEYSWYDNGTETPAVTIHKVIDTEPDIFYYDIPGYSGKFIIDKKRGAVLFNRSHNLKVEHDYIPSLHKIVLKITDPAGNQYFFNDKEHSRYYTSNTWLNQNGTTYNPKYDDNPENFTVWMPTIRNEYGEVEYDPGPCSPYRMCSSWCLSSIVTHTGRTINFTYTGYDEYLPTQESTEVYNNRHSGNQFYYKSKVVNEGWQLTRISWDFGSVELTCSAREDIKGTAKKVDRIKVYDNSRIMLKSYLFNYSYFNDDYSGEDKYKHVFKRLKLLSLLEQNSGEKHEFSYYEGSFPAKNSKNVDYWGMQNGRNYGAQYQIGVYAGSNKYKGVQKGANPAYAVIGMLQRIQYPTGGYAHFTYEGNDVGIYYDAITNNDTALDNDGPQPGEPDSTVTEPWNQSYSVVTIGICNNYVVNEHPDLPSDSTLTFTLTGTTQIGLECHLENHDCYFRDPDYQYYSQPLGHLKRISSPTQTFITYECPFVFERGSGNLSQGEGCEVDVIRHWYTLSPGTYEFKAYCPPKDVSAEWKLTFDRKSPLRARAAGSSGKGGGLRIASIETNGGTRTFRYHGGKTLAEPTFYYFGNRIGDGSFLEQCIVQVSESRTPLSTFNNGNIVGYDWVEESLESDGVTFQTRYYYYNELEEKYDDNPRYAYSPAVVNYHNGLLQKVEYYEDDNLIKEEDYSYLTNHGNQIFAMIDFGGKYNTDEMLTYNYNLQWPLKSRCIVREFDNGLILSDTCNFVYNGRDLLSQKIHRIDSKSYSEHYKYPFDFSDNISLSMVRNNTIKQPVETFFSVDGKVYAGTKTEHLDSTQYFMPAQIYRLETQTGTTEAARNSCYASFVQYEKYGPHGTLRQIRDKGVVTSYIWGYKYQFPIAVVENAEYSSLESTLGGSTRVNSFSTVPNPSDEGVRQFLQPIRTYGNVYRGNATIYSYKQLVGPTSITLPDGVCTYYEYDSAGRLVRIKDTHGKVVKTYTYHYKY